MDSKQVIAAMAALAQEGRLSVFRLLVETGPEGLAAGEIARRLSIGATTLSGQLTVLANAGLVVGRRDGRSIIYAVEFGAVRDLMLWLLRDCCGGRPEVCGGALAGLADVSGAKT